MKAVLEENIEEPCQIFKIEEFENSIKQYCNVRYACAVNSGTAALHLAVHSLNLNNDDEIQVK